MPRDPARRAGVLPQLLSAGPRRAAVEEHGRLAPPRAGHGEEAVPGTEGERRGRGRGRRPRQRQGRTRRPRWRRRKKRRQRPGRAFVQVLPRGAVERGGGATRACGGARGFAVPRRRAPGGVPREGLRGHRLRRRKRARRGGGGHPLPQPQGQAGGAQAQVQQRETRQEPRQRLIWRPMVLAAGVSRAQPGGWAVLAAQERPRRRVVGGREVQRRAHAEPPQVAQAGDAEVRGLRRLRRGVARVLHSPGATRAAGSRASRTTAASTTTRRRGAAGRWRGAGPTSTPTRRS